MKSSKELQNKIHGMIGIIGTSQPTLQKLGRVLNSMDKFPSLENLKIYI